MAWNITESSKAFRAGTGSYFWGFEHHQAMGSGQAWVGLGHVGLVFTKFRA